MKKFYALSALTLCLVFLMLLCGCSPASAGKPEKADPYAGQMNRLMVSFTDCAGRFSASLESIGGSLSAPSDSQIADAERSLDALEKVCAALKGNKAPDEYAAAQEQLDQAMTDYGEAFEKCRALLDFFKSYDSEYHRFSDPKAGKAKIEKKERALYSDFAESMLKAGNSFRRACEEFERSQTPAAKT